MVRTISRVPLFLGSQLTGKLVFKFDDGCIEVRGLCVEICDLQVFFCGFNTLIVVTI